MVAKRRALGAAAMMMAVSAVQAAAPASRLPKGLETGEWELRGRGEDGAARKLCVSSLSQLLQSRHAGHACKSFTVSDVANRLVVTYECGAAGNGRTDLRVETSRLVQIQSQGIADGAPFAFALEGRWLGACH
ncbi:MULTISPECIES: hypothetical protein [Sphingobium]|jgi:hypothetical protein|uniref:DUF3617 family protein n=2 Tax=Sphingobium fuliginis (strain ATCC 27551) TaxID=336203 RepID=A0A292ZK62_SPHSA|nr:MULTISPECIES: hypothetical protein [Sphingobium]MCB4862908.1 hypothetical protein [Sphingobium sp. PNB]QDC38098.1 hypothetical protein FIL70_13570 [Sphingobium fuliginis ATCC 27551]QOT70753.1 hypothetical protein H5V43_11555 [Sphingobium fuliginis]RYM01152.1 hypothetical protein EWH10_03685 [Sphingobium fuliginis]UXC89811.1 hypothetical protein EGM87_12165 [Sphingobium sp. RSMS]